MKDIFGKINLIPFTQIIYLKKFLNKFVFFKKVLPRVRL